MDEGEKTWDGKIAKLLHEPALAMGFAETLLHMRASVCKWTDMTHSAAKGMKPNALFLPFDRPSIMPSKAE